MISEAFFWIVSQHVLAHCLVGLVLMAVICGVLQLARVYAFAWHAAAYVSLYFFTRESAQAERALKPTLGDPLAYFWTLWPGHWTAGGARLWEWLAPTLVVLAIAALTPRTPFLRRPRELKLGRERRL
jgi:hypothetical protein